MSLRDGSKKMSKSDASEFSRINLTDGPDAIADKIRKARTDPLPLPETVAELQARPEADNLVGIYAALTDATREAALGRFAGKLFSDFKRELVEVAVEHLGRIGTEMQRLLADPAEIDAVLKDGGRRAAALAAPVMDEVRRIVGFLTP